MSDPREAPIPLQSLDYALPSELIAQQPVEPRDSARLLVVSRATGALEDRVFHELPDLLRPGDLLVVNDTRVIPARLFGRRRTGGRVELLLLARRGDGDWDALARPARRLRAGEQLDLIRLDESVSDDAVEIVGRSEGGVVLRFASEDAIRRHGRVPLPPYIREQIDDPERYQTVYSRDEGSAAAPTAGLHFTDDIFQRCHARGVERVAVTLHVGVDTFLPITEADAREHRIHSERFQVSQATLHAVWSAKREGRRVVAVGTTSVRTLESVADIVTADDAPNGSTGGATRLYITPGYRYRVVDALLTNFHLPRTTLLLLVSAFAGERLIREAYEHAVAARYRFYSFGDAMLIV